MRSKMEVGQKTLQILMFSLRKNIRMLLRKMLS